MEIDPRVCRCRCHTDGEEDHHECCFYVAAVERDSLKAKVADEHERGNEYRRLAEDLGFKKERAEAEVTDLRARLEQEQKAAPDRCCYPVGSNACPWHDGVDVAEAEVAELRARLEEE